MRRRDMLTLSSSAGGHFHPVLFKPAYMPNVIKDRFYTLEDGMG